VTDMGAASVLEEAGFTQIPGALATGRCAELATAIDGGSAGRAGARNLLDVPLCQKLAVTFKAHAQVGPLLPDGAVAVQCTLFDKSPERNWLVALHQDFSIPVRERVSHPECTGWSEKEGVLYVQPPVAVLELLVAVRAHLDDCGPASGPLRVVPGSHRHGRLSAEAARALRAQRGDVECVARRGDVLVLRPLLLHSSSKAHSTAPRRILHFLFGPQELACGLKWHRAV
jgi:ectoine hydroxylase-related dioxygenase (phytanoyl-CoA dioxygenase family)